MFPGFPGTQTLYLLFFNGADLQDAHVRIEMSRVVAGGEAVPVFRLSEAEHRVALLVARGMRNEEVATQLCLSVNTVRAHLRQVFEKLMVSHRGQLAAKLPLIRRTVEN